MLKEIVPRRHWAADGAWGFVFGSAATEVVTSFPCVWMYLCIYICMYVQYVCMYYVNINLKQKKYLYTVCI